MDARGGQGRLPPVPPAGASLVYQPIVDLQTGRAVRLEALLCLPGPDGTPIGPLAYLAGLDSRATAELGRWVRSQAFAEVAELRRRTGATVGVSVNIDAREMSNTWAADVLRTITAAPLAAPHVTLELAHGAPFAEPGGLGALRELSYAGVALALDDIGTGFNALALLQTLPVTELKIDRSFVRNLTPVSTSSAIVRGLVGVAHDLSLNVVAEGIETQAQLDLLRDFSVEQGQGYLLGRPAPIAELAESVTEVDPAAVARDLIRVLHLSGASPSTIAAALNGRGLRTEEGQRWHRESVARAVAEIRSDRRDPPA